MTTNRVQELDESNFDQGVSEGLTLVDFWAPWCAPCRMMAPVLEELAQRHSDLAIAKVNVEESPVLAARFRVQAIPLLVLFKDGEEVDRFIGLRPADDLSGAIQRHME